MQRRFAAISGIAAFAALAVALAATDYTAVYAATSLAPDRTNTASPSASAATALRADSAAHLPTKPFHSLWVKTIGGKSIDLAAVSGYKVIYFFSIGCPCVRSCEKLSFIPLAGQYLGKVSFFAVTSGAFDLQDNRANFVGLVATHHLPFPVVLDPTHAVANSLGGIAASQCVILGPDDRMLYSGMADDSKDYHDRTGLVGMTKSYLADALSEIFAGQPVAVPWTQPRGCSIAQ